MRKARGRARFLSEAGRKIEGPHDVLSDQFHRDRSLEHVVHGCVDRPHSPAAKAALEAVATVEQAGTACRRQRLMVVRAHVCASIEASPAALALCQGMPSPDERSSRTPTACAMVTGGRDPPGCMALRNAGARARETREADRPRAGWKSDEQLDAVLDQQRALLDRELVPHPCRIPERKRERLPEDRQHADDGERRGQRTGLCSAAEPDATVSNIASPGARPRTLTNSGCSASSICCITDGAMASKCEARLICSAMLLRRRCASYRSRKKRRSTALSQCSRRSRTTSSVNPTSVNHHQRDLSIAISGSCDGWRCRPAAPIRGPG